MELKPPAGVPGGRSALSQDARNYQSVEATLLGATAAAGTNAVYLTSMPRRTPRNRKTVRPTKKRTSATPALRALMAAGHSAAQHRKGGSLSGEFAAPMTTEIEQQLEQLIAKFGYEKVCDALAPLVEKCAFKDWLCVANAVDRLARKVRQRRLKKVN